MPDARKRFLLNRTGLGLLYMVKVVREHLEQRKRIGNMP